MSAAAIRPDEWNLPLFLHILGALALVGAVTAAAYYLFRARRDSSPALARYGFRALLLGAIPSYLVTRVAAQWLLDEEGLTDSEDAWITIGFIVTDAGLLLLIAATVAAGIAARRAEGSIGRGPSIAAWSCSVLLVTYTVALWAMAAKPL
ncbi:MAG: hypothetical protein ACR2G3_11585 [Solirubrobacterales bacterium]